MQLNARLVPGLFPVPVLFPFDLFLLGLFLFSALLPALLLALAVSIPGLAVLVSVAHARVAGEFRAAALAPALPGHVAGAGIGAVAARVSPPDRPAGEAFHAGPPAVLGFLSVVLVRSHAAPGRAFFVPAVAEYARESSCHGVGSGNAAAAGAAAAPPGDSDFPNSAVGSQAAGRAPAQSGDPSDPSRGAAAPNHAPSDDSRVVAHTTASRKSTPAAAGSNAPEYAG